MWPTGVTLCFLTCIFAVNTGDPREFCQLETFRAQCDEGHVIVMETARYGRMMLGRCLTRNYYVGCSSNVLTHMDAKCSGRLECEVPIPDPVLFQAQPCPKDLVAYLEASYTCLAVVAPKKETCKMYGYIRLVDKEGYIASVLTWEKGLGTPECPWRIEAEAGKRIRLHLLDFALEDAQLQAKAVPSSAPSSPSSSLDMCRTYGYIKERNGKMSSTICGTDKRQTHIYTSETNSVDLLFFDGVFTMPAFLIKYEVFGCPLPDIQPEAWIEHKGDTAIVRCNNSEVFYHLFCDGSSWIGEAKNCSKVASVEMQQTSGSPMPFGLFIAISIGVALGVLLGIGLLVLSYSFYNKYQREKRLQAKHDENILLKEQLSSCGRSQYSDMGEIQHSLQHMHYVPKVEFCGHPHETFLPMMPSKDHHHREHYECPGKEEGIYIHRPIPCFHDGDSGVDATSVMEGNHLTSDLQLVDVLPPCGTIERQQRIREGTVFRGMNKDICVIERDTSQSQGQHT